MSGPGRPSWTVSPSDLLWYAEQVRDLAAKNDVAGCADLIAQHLEWHARCLLIEDITGASS